MKPNANSISNPYGITQCVCQSDGHSVGSCGANCGVNGGDAGSTAVPLTVVYDNGFVLKPVDINKTPFSMTINSWFQARHSYFDSHGLTADQNDFEFERTRLAFRGIALSPDLKYFFQFDADDNQIQRLDLLDYFLSYDIGHSQLGLAVGQMGIRVGRWKIPFNRSRQTSAYHKSVTPAQSTRTPRVFHHNSHAAMIDSLPPES